MAKDYKEGVDFEWVKGNAKNTKVRRFFSAAEKKALSAPKPTATATTPATSKPKTKAVVKEKPSPVSGASRSTDGKVKDKKPVAGVSGASRSVAGKVSDQAKRNAKRAKEPVAALLYDKAYGKDKWKPKK